MFTTNPHDKPRWDKLAETFPGNRQIFDGLRKLDETKRAFRRQTTNRTFNWNEHVKRHRQAVDKHRDAQIAILRRIPTFKDMDDEKIVSIGVSLRQERFKPAQPIISSFWS